MAYNEANGIEPTALRKKIADILDMLAREDADTEELIGAGRQQSRGKAPVPGLSAKRAGRHAADLVGERPREEMESLIDQMTQQMHHAAEELQFEVAARLRDEIKELKRELRDMKEAGVK
jgi:excinuclease ABC subunit B